MNQAILKILDEMIENLDELGKWYSKKDLTWVYVHQRLDVRRTTLEEVKHKISSLPLDTQWIDTLQRYNTAKPTDFIDTTPIINESESWEYVKYSDLVELLNR